MERVVTIGFDIAKSVFQVHGIDGTGAVVVRRKLARGRVLTFFEALPRCQIGMEACNTSHYWARELIALDTMCGLCQHSTSSLRQAGQERCSRRGANLRGGDAAHHALRSG